MARQLRFFAAELERAGIPVAPRLSSEAGLEFDALEGKLAQLESELLELNGNSDRLHRSHNELLELQVGARFYATPTSCWPTHRPAAALAGLGTSDSLMLAVLLVSRAWQPRSRCCGLGPCRRPCREAPIQHALVLQLVLERAGSFFEDARSSADRAQRESASAAYSDSERFLTSAELAVG